MLEREHNVVLFSTGDIFKIWIVPYQLNTHMLFEPNLILEENI